VWKTYVLVCRSSGTSITVFPTVTSSPQSISWTPPSSFYHSISRKAADSKPFQTTIHNETPTNRQRNTARQRTRMGMESPDGKAADEVPIMRHDITLSIPQASYPHPQKHRLPPRLTIQESGVYNTFPPFPNTPLNINTVPTVCKVVESDLSKHQHYCIYSPCPSALGSLLSRISMLPVISVSRCFACGCSVRRTLDDVETLLRISIFSRKLAHAGFALQIE